MNFKFTRSISNVSLSGPLQTAKVIGRTLRSGTMWRVKSATDDELGLRCQEWQLVDKARQRGPHLPLPLIDIIEPSWIAEYVSLHKNTIPSFPDSSREVGSRYERHRAQLRHDQWDCINQRYCS
jgi:hypothetical protein